MQTLIVKTDRRTQFLNVTEDVQKAVAGTKISNGICYLYVPHTTAAITLNECADPDVASDIGGAMDHVIPTKGPYRHAEGNSDSHVKTVLTGNSLNVFVQGGKLVLGTWQGLFFCEYDGPRERKLLVKVLADRD